MTHEQAKEELSALLDGALEPARRREVELHMASCEACKVHFDSLRAAVALFKKHGRAQAPVLLKTSVLAKAMQPEDPVASAFATTWKPALAWSFAAAVALFASTSAIKTGLPGLFEQEQGMISGAAGSLGGSENFSMPAGAQRSEDAAAPEAAPSFARASARRSGVAAKAVEIGSYMGGRAGAGLAGGAAQGVEGKSLAGSLSEAEPAGPVPLLRLFRDEAPFRAFWGSLTRLPAPQVDFSRSMVAVLADPPAGSLWAVTGTDETEEGPRILYRQIPAPRLPPGAPAPVLPPAFQVFPKSDRIVSLKKIR